MAAAQRHDIALILSGGGARAAYQAGVLRFIAEELTEPGAPLPFRILCGSSAGGVNATLLACHAADFRAGVEHCVSLWSRLTVADVFRIDSLSLGRMGLRVLRRLALGGAGADPVHSLLDTSPLARFLEKHLAFATIPGAIAAGHLLALTMTTTCYDTGRTVVFVQGAPGTETWRRVHRETVLAEIGVEHVLASAAIPILFPAVRIAGRYYGDGSLRNHTPLSPPAHLGASRVLVVGVRARSFHVDFKEPPSPARVLGVMMNVVFLDNFEIDWERMAQVNYLLTRLEASDKGIEPELGLRHIDTHIIRPTADIGALAAPHFPSLPVLLRYLLRGLGADRQSGSDLVSYLLFEPGYCRQLIELGYRDAVREKEILSAFMRVGP